MSKVLIIIIIIIIIIRPHRMCVALERSVASTVFMQWREAWAWRQHRWAASVTPSTAQSVVMHEAFDGETV